MPLKIGLTGKPRIGKSTIVKVVIERLKADGVPVGGMLTADLREHGRRVGFTIEDIRTGETGVLAHVQLPTRGPTVGKYTVNLTDLDNIGARSIVEATIRPEIKLIIIDEIGTMELKSRNFIEAVERALASEKHLVVTVHQRSMHELVQRIRRTFEILEVTEANRDDLPTMVMAALRNSTDYKNLNSNEP
ncbi:MAG TPA: NTPase [Methanomicrobia archaeon]|nr:NTPase [Methanomicrobia archaeon]